MAMQYLSTRGGAAAAGFGDILLGGLMPDGGLAVPDAYPQARAAELEAWRPLGYRELAFEILRRYAPEMPQASLQHIVDKTYTAAVFGTDTITPLEQLEPGVHLLGLSHGPTLAFKDIA